MYCFITEDLIGCDDSNPLYIQAEYAKHLELFCQYSITNNTLTDSRGYPVDLSGVKVLLRGTYVHALPAIAALHSRGVSVVETQNDFLTIERWNELPFICRTILTSTAREFLQGIFSRELLLLLNSVEAVFIKSRKKGFSVLAPSKAILEFAPCWIHFLKTHCTSNDDELLVSKKYDIAADSLGKRESRHIVLEGKFLNSSRPIHSLKHSVPMSHKHKAEEFIKQILDTENFPKSFVLDLGEFVDHGKTFFDIVEINPLTCSLCYVNNTIFDIIMPNITSVCSRTNMGYEYCYDSLAHPERYFSDRFTGESFEYYSADHYSLL